MTTYFIYKICCNDSSCADFYIGSTQNVRLRKSQHKQSCINESNKKHNLLIYTKIREYGGWGNWRMVVIEEMPNTTHIQAKIREEHYRVELQATLNMCSAYSGLSYNELPKNEYQKAYQEKNKDTLGEQKKAYYEKNKDKINETIVCSCGNTILKRSLKRHLTTKIHNNTLTNTT